MAVAVGSAGKEFNGMIKLNETGAFFWNELEAGISKEDLLAKMMEKFEDLDEATARADLDEYLNEIAFALEECEE